MKEKKCKEKGCGTLLNSYNKTCFCNIHLIKHLETKAIKFLEKNKKYRPLTKPVSLKIILEHYYSSIIEKLKKDNVKFKIRQGKKGVTIYIKDKEV